MKDRKSLLVSRSILMKKCSLLAVALLILLLKTSVFGQAAPQRGQAFALPLPARYNYTYWRNNLSLHDWKYYLSFGSNGNIQFTVNEASPSGTPLKYYGKAEYRGDKIIAITSEYSHKTNKNVEKFGKKPGKWILKIAGGRLVLIKTPQGRMHILMKRFDASARDGLVDRPSFN